LRDRVAVEHERLNVEVGRWWLALMKRGNFPAGQAL
jgi:hypothetical protein